MKSYATAAAFRRALEDRLASIAKVDHIDLQRLRRLVAFDRLLVRLFMDGNPPWLIKGGYALEMKLHLARATRDLDLGLASFSAGEADLLEALQTSAETDVGDWFHYVIGEAAMDLDGAPYGGSRHPVEARLDGRPFAKFHLDIGLGDIQREPVEWIQSRDWLGFAGFGPGRFPTIPREEHFAQKLHAYTIPRGERTNTRVKDLVDLVLLIDSGLLNLDRLKRDIADTFRRRATHEVPGQLEAPPDFWAPVFAKLAEECSISGDINAQFERVRDFMENLWNSRDC